MCRHRSLVDSQLLVEDLLGSCVAAGGGQAKAGIHGVHRSGGGVWEGGPLHGGGGGRPVSVLDPVVQFGGEGRGLDVAASAGCCVELGGGIRNTCIKAGERLT